MRSTSEEGTEAKALMQSTSKDGTEAGALAQTTSGESKGRIRIQVSSQMET